MEMPKPNVEDIHNQNDEIIQLLENVDDRLYNLEGAAKERNQLLASILYVLENRN